MKTASKAISGAAAGFGATVAMTAVMWFVHRLFPESRHRRLPPDEITQRAMNQVAGKEDERAPSRRIGFVASHAGFGMTMGGLFAAIAPRPWRHRLSAGAAFGLLVWGASYLGWLPLTGLQPRPENQPRGRHAALTLSHLVWGACLVRLLARVETESFDHLSTGEAHEETRTRSERSSLAG